MATGWLIGVLVEQANLAPTRHFFAVAQPDRARAEWAAADRAALVGDIAPSPYRGMEPVEAIRDLDVHAIASLGLKAGEIKSFGDKWPRRLLTPVVAPEAEIQR